MIRVRVPATSANLGPGFDVMGLAINRYNIFTFTETKDRVQDNIIYDAYNRVFQYLGRDIIPVRIEVEAEIPMARGLGSSSTCVVGGIIGANVILGYPLSKEEILRLATEIEGHPDNAAPAIYGGLVVSVMEETTLSKSIIPIKNSLAFIALVPDFELSTSEARSVLPEEIPLSDGIYNVGRACMLLTALMTGNNDLIRVGLQDRFHQSRRGKMIPGFDEITSTAYKLGALGCYLSGAGSTIMCIADGGDSHFIENINGFMKNNYPDWKVYCHKIDEVGAEVL